MTRLCSTLTSTLLFSSACSNASDVAVAGDTSADAGDETPATSATPTTTVTTDADESGPEPGTTDTTPGSEAPADGGSSSESGGPKWDVGGAVDPGACDEAEAGIYCSEGAALECDGVGNVVSSESCVPDTCLQGVGCVTCVEGQYHCSGPRVMMCNADVEPAVWAEIDVCDMQAGEGCDQALGSCELLQIVGSNVPTGDYYQYAEFNSFNGYSGGWDVDTFGDKIYVSNANDTSIVKVYEVTLHDSDGDGEKEPNQHPDNPDDHGPIEERTLEFVENVNMVNTFGTASEIYAIEDRIYIGGYGINEYVFGVVGATLVAPAAEIESLALIGYDDINGVWYAANENARRVYQHDAETDTWGIAFNFPNLAGDHMDGLEVVTDPNTGVPYVYVSDMTSDFIGQYRLDPNEGWVQHNLFQYDGTAGQLVEGMGFGAFNHFWATSGDALYEVGGGDLAMYTEPTPTG